MTKNLTYDAKQDEKNGFKVLVFIQPPELIEKNLQYEAKLCPG